jgi:ABC-2 type transport system permease protein
LLLVAGISLGVDLHWLRIPEALLILAITTVGYVGIGLVGAALVVAVRTNAAIPQGVLVLSTILGGVYFPTSVLPPAIAPLAEWLPLTPGLRALRQSLLLGYPIGSVSGDLVRVTALSALTFAAGVISIKWAFAYARRAGSLSQY